MEIRFCAIFSFVVLLFNTSADGLVNNTLPAFPVNNVLESPNGCPPAQNPLLNALVLQLLLSSLQQPIQNQGFSTAFINPTPTVAEPRVTLITSSLIRTVTELLSTPVGIWFKNQRITSTIFSSNVRKITEVVTVTSTLGNSLRNKRDNRIETSFQPNQDAESSQFSMEQLQEILEKQQNDPGTNLRISSLVNRPEVQKAWQAFSSIVNDEFNK